MEKKPKILYVDDEPINLLILKKMLGSKYEVITAEEGRKALDILKADPDIQLIISDMRMPIMTGLEMIEESSRRFQNKKYFMLSGYDIKEEIQEALDNGLIIAYFQKPADFKEIERALEEHA